MASALFQQNLRIQIQDDLKFDIRIENADLDRYFHCRLVLKVVFSDVCAAAAFTMRMTKVIS